jgi:hypothetical protein
MMVEVAEIMIMSIDANVKITCHTGDIYQQKKETKCFNNILRIVQKDLMSGAEYQQIGITIQDTITLNYLLNNIL